MKEITINGTTYTLTPKQQINPLDTITARNVQYPVPSYFREKSSGIVVKFTEQLSRDALGIVVESNLNIAQKTLGFDWRCWCTAQYPDRWEYLPDYVEQKTENKLKIYTVEFDIDWGQRCNRRIVTVNVKAENKKAAVDDVYKILKDKYCENMCLIDFITRSEVNELILGSIYHSVNAHN